MVKFYSQYLSYIVLFMHHIIVVLYLTVYCFTLADQTLPDAPVGIYHNLCKCGVLLYRE